MAAPTPIASVTPQPWYHRRWFIVLAVAVVVVGLFGWLIFRELVGTTAGNPSEFTVAPGTFTPNTSVSATVVSSDDPYLGTPGAKVTLVEFGDFECPFCRQTAPTIRTLMATYDDRVQFIFRDFPLDSIHPMAQQAAEAGACIWHLKPDSFWSFHDRAYQNQALLSADSLLQWSVQAGADENTVHACLTNGTYTNEVKEDLATGINAGVRGTPTFFLNGRKIEGVLPLDTWKRLIDQAIADAAS